MNRETPDEQRIIRDVLSGRREEFARLVRAHQAKVLSLCLSLLKDPAEAEDAAAEIFLKAYQKLKDFRFDAAFSTWLYRIAYRHSLDLLRARQRRRAQSLDALLEERGEGALPPAPDQTTPADPARTAESLLSSLPPDYRLVLTLREVQGLSYEEIARAMDASLDSVKARLRRARQALRSHRLPAR